MIEIAVVHRNIYYTYTHRNYIINIILLMLLYSLHLTLILVGFVWTLLPSPQRACFRV